MTICVRTRSCSNPHWRGEPPALAPMMRFHSALSILAVVAGLLCSSSASAAPAARPNVLLILADDLGWSDIGCYGAPDIRTPELDRLASQGVRFTQFYANGTECTPSRTALLTGRYQQRVGGLECAIGIGGVGRYDDAMRLAEAGELGLPASETTIAEMVRDAGYATAMSGKWHLGYADKFSPNRHGFQHALYAEGGGMDYFHHVEDPPSLTHVLRLDEKPLMRPGEYFTELAASDAIDWITTHNTRAPDQPWFVYLPFTTPHSPYQAPDEAFPEPLPPDSKRWKQGQSPPDVYATMIESMDREIGRILDTLEQLGLSENTLVIFTNDNGGTKSQRPNPFRDIKGTSFEGGIRVPAIIRWPGRLQPGTEYPHPAALFDLTVSIARITGVPLVVDGRPRFDGVDILASVAAGEAPPERSLFWRGRRADRTWRAARDGAMKYVTYQEGTSLQEWLFDVEKDPGESHDLLGNQKYADTATSLKQQLEAWEQDVRPTR